MACLQALFLYQLMVMGTDQLYSQITLEGTNCLPNIHLDDTNWDVCFELININYPSFLFQSL